MSSMATATQSLPMANLLTETQKGKPAGAGMRPESAAANSKDPHADLQEDLCMAIEQEKTYGWSDEQAAHVL